MEARLVKLQSGNKRAWVYPEHGFQLYGFEQDFGKKTVPVIYVPGRDQIEPSDRRYGNPILFPIPSLVRTPSCGMDTWKRYGKITPMPFHGFARNLYWQVLEIRKDRVTAILIPNTESKLSFPYKFTLKATYRLDSRGLVLDIEVKNKDKKKFPYALGFHPYLRAPLGPKGTVKDTVIHIPEGKLSYSHDKWRTYHVKKYPATKVRGDKYLKGSLIVSDIKNRYLELHDQANGFTTRVSVEGSKTAFPYWTIWSASKDAPFMCIEPWTTIPNGLNFGKARSCKPNQTDHYQMIISVRR